MVVAHASPMHVSHTLTCVRILRRWETHLSFWEGVGGHGDSVIRESRCASLLSLSLSLSFSLSLSLTLSLCLSLALSLSLSTTLPL